VKYLGIDYGSKWVGVAVSNENGTIAFPRSTLANDKGLTKSLREIISKEKIGRIIVGDTRTHGGGSNPVTEEAEAFIEDLARETRLPVSRVFEVFSSIEASRYAPKGQGHDDAAAAAVILQRFLDMNVSR
jgi:putative Holliday junction resolvase